MSPTVAFWMALIGIYLIASGRLQQLIAVIFSVAQTPPTETPPPEGAGGLTLDQMLNFEAWKRQ